jgi:succinate-semialdehyde dehydrogenase/glutarate-semialdehyde dehydrogenase
MGQFRATDPSQIPELVAQTASVQPLWALLRVTDRARYMRRVAQAIIDEFSELVGVLAAEQGRPRSELATLELLPAIDALIWMADAGAEIMGAKRIPVHRSMFLTKRGRVAYEPLGVIGVIGSDSAPFAEPLGQIAAALLAGNGVIFKPAPETAATAERIARLLARAGLPEGLVVLAHGGAPVGQALAQAPVDKLLFTGSARVGREIAQTCVSENRALELALEGSDAMLLAPDAHLPRAASCAVWAGFAAAGGARGSIERIYAHRDVAERFTELLLQRTRGLRVGDPLDWHTQVGPLPSASDRLRLQELIQDALARGARLDCGGPVAPPDGLTGSFFAPAVLSGVTHEMRVMREPINGPLLALMSVESMSAAIALANECECGLGASVWTADRHQALRMACELKTGMVWLNDHLPTPMIAQAPWGAGEARTFGEAGLRACAREKLITWDPSGSRGLWWGPHSQTLARAAQSVAELRSARDAHREHAWRRGGLALARVGIRALRHRGG